MTTYLIAVLCAVGLLVPAHAQLPGLPALLELEIINSTGSSPSAGTARPTPPSFGHLPTGFPPAGHPSLSQRPTIVPALPTRGAPTFPPRVPAFNPESYVPVEPPRPFQPSEPIIRNKRAATTPAPTRSTTLKGASNATPTRPVGTQTAAPTKISTVPSKTSTVPSKISTVPSKISTAAPSRNTQRPTSAAPLRPVRQAPQQASTPAVRPPHYTLGITRPTPARPLVRSSSAAPSRPETTEYYYRPHPTASASRPTPVSQFLPSSAGPLRPVRQVSSSYSTSPPSISPTFGLNRPTSAIPRPTFGVSRPTISQPRPTFAPLRPARQVFLSGSTPEDIHPRPTFGVSRSTVARPRPTASFQQQPTSATPLSTMRQTPQQGSTFAAIASSRPTVQLPHQRPTAAASTTAFHPIPSFGAPLRPARQAPLSPCSTPGSRVQYPGECTQFFECGDRGTLQVKTCPHTTFYNWRTSKCESAISVCDDHQGDN